MAVLRQALCTFILCWIRMSFSTTFSWPAFTVNQFLSQDTPLHRPMTGTESALFGSMSSIGAVIFTPILGLLLDVLGRKKCMILAALCHVLNLSTVCWIRMSFSTTFSWPAFTVNQFLSQDTPLHRPMTGTESALFGSMSSIGAVIFTPILGLLLDVLGRKKCMILAALCHVLAWTIIVFSNRVEAVLAGMFIAGAGISCFVAIPVYITEVCQPAVRGTMASCMLIAFGLGMLWSYILGGLLPYTLMCWVCLTIAVVGALMTMTLTESPVFLMRKGKEDEAVQSMGFYRKAAPNSVIVMQEIDSIRKTLGVTEAVATKEGEKQMEIEPAQNMSYWKFFKSSKSTRKAAALVMILITCSMFHGYVAVIVYTEPLFLQAVPSMSPVLCSVLLAVTNIIANLLSAYLVDIAGRRPLMLYSSLGSGVCCVLLGSQIQMHWGPHAMSAVIIFLFCFVYSLGAGGIPFVLAAEVFVPQVSSILSMIAYEVAWVCTFALLYAFTPLIALVGLDGLFYLFAVICFSTAVYAAYYLPETKLLTVDDIQKLF